MSFSYSLDSEVIYPNMAENKESNNVEENVIELESDVLIDKQYNTSLVETRPCKNICSRWKDSYTLYLILITIFLTLISIAIFGTVCYHNNECGIRKNQSMIISVIFFLLSAVFAFQIVCPIMLPLD